MYTYRKVISVCSLILLITIKISAQEVQRPVIWGIAKMTFLVSDVMVAHD